MWQPEVDKLLQLKKQVIAAQTQANTASAASVASTDSKDDVASLEKAITEQV